MDNHVSTPSPFGDRHNNRLTLFPAARLSKRAEIAVTDEVRDLLEPALLLRSVYQAAKIRAPSRSVPRSISIQLDTAGRRILVHSDLGRIEWRQSMPVCERLAEYLGLDLVVVRRRKGDLLDRLWQRWHGNIRRYAELSSVKLILPWPTAAMRFCAPAATDPHQGVEQRTGGRIPALVSAVSRPGAGRSLTPDLEADSLFFQCFQVGWLPKGDVA